MFFLVNINHNSNLLKLKQQHQFSLLLLHAIILILSLTTLIQNGVTSCSIAEYECDNKQCIQLDGYCNGVKQCRDGSDEKLGCSPCNRTYYGLQTFTYKLSLHAAQLCTFTFIAAGDGIFGDIIQLSLPLIDPSSTTNNMQQSSSTNSFNTNPSLLPNNNNCTSILTLIEPNQISKFCLSTSFNSSKVNYYSNSNKITVSFIHNIEVVYRFLPSVILTKGVLLQGTICSILYENCSRSNVNSIGRGGLGSTSYNYYNGDSDSMYSATSSSDDSLGLYQLNNGIRDMNEFNGESNNGHQINSINNNCLVRSPNYPGIIANNVSCYYAFRESYGSLIHIQGSVRLSDDCESYLVVYDGYSIRDRVLGKYCGDMNVDVISGGNEMLVEFYSGKYGLWKTRGLQLKATALSSTLSTPCQTTISSIISTSNSVGTLSTPLSTLSNTTTCSYNFQGTSKQLIWFMFQQFDASDGGELIFTDGTKSITFSNSTLPPLCELLYLPLHRPCKIETESILSDSNAVTIELNLPKLQFKLQYVFIEPSNCNFNKHYTISNGQISSTKHLFDFGAGGTKNLKCMYDFNENTRIVLRDASFEGNCKMVKDEVTGRTKCKYSLSQRAQHTRLEYHQVINQTSILKQCFCGNQIKLPLILTSNYKARLFLIGFNMGKDISPENSYFSGTFSKLGTPPCTSTHYLQVSTKSSFSYYSNCESFLMLLPKPSIYIKLEGCAIVHTDYDFNYMCDNDLFAPGFKNSSLTNNIYIELVSSLVINYLQVFNPLEPNYNYVLDSTGTQVAAPEPYHLPGLKLGGIGGEEEQVVDTCGGFKCTSINACIDKELFCNGNINCPHAEDEVCSLIDYTYLYLFIGIVLLIGALSLLYTGIKRTRDMRKGVG